MMFYVGLHQPADAKHFDRAFISVNRIRRRKKAIQAGAWIMDSGAFTEISKFGEYRSSVAEYAEVINRWADDPKLVAAVSQDYMCEPFILEKTGLTVADHQRLTIERYDALRLLVDPRVYVMPVLQGYSVEDYLRHLEMYGNRLPRGAYVGVGSICKRNTDIKAVEAILTAIKAVRPDLRLHGFGLKITALSSWVVRDCLYSADSMAWSFSARRQGRNANDWREAMAFVRRINIAPIQLAMDFNDEYQAEQARIPRRAQKVQPTALAKALLRKVRGKGRAIRLQPKLRDGAGSSGSLRRSKGRPQTEEIRMEPTRATSGGLEPRFVIERADGKPIDPTRRYSLVLDFSGADPHALVAAKAYADSIRPANVQLADDIEAAISNPAAAPAQHRYA